MTQPLIFISHKHTDRPIATVIRNFIDDQSKGNLRVFQSSDATAVGPSVAGDLTAELQKALWEAKAVILVYTTADKDWGYCMWECGVATKPGSPPTKIIVFQCADRVPSVYGGQVVVDARTKDGLASFVTQFMTVADFLPGVPGPLTGFQPESRQVKEAIAKLHADLAAVLPQGDVNEWPAHPLAKVEIPASVVDAINNGNSACDATTHKNLLLSHAQIVWADSEARRIFGLAPLSDNLAVSELIERWKQARPTASDTWIDEVIQQVLKCVRWQFPLLRWTKMQAVPDNQPYAPVVTWVKRLPTGAMQFRLYFFPFNFLAATPVTSRMVKHSTLYFRRLSPGGEDKIKVIDLLRDLDTRGVNRVPFLDDGNKVLYLCHRSLLDQFMARRLTSGSLAGLDTVTLADVFAEQPALKDTISRTFGFVPLAATLAQAQIEMAKIPGCRDIFVTASGSPNEPVEGLVTDVIIATGD